MRSAYSNKNQRFNYNNKSTQQITKARNEINKNNNTTSTFRSYKNGKLPVSIDLVIVKITAYTINLCLIKNNLLVIAMA